MDCDEAGELCAQTQFCCLHSHSCLVSQQVSLEGTWVSSFVIGGSMSAPPSWACCEDSTRMPSEGLDCAWHSVFYYYYTIKKTLMLGLGKDPDAARDWGQEEKGTTEDEMAGWHH